MIIDTKNAKDTKQHLESYSNLDPPGNLDLCRKMIFFVNLRDLSALGVNYHPDTSSLESEAGVADGSGPACSAVWQMD